MDGATKLAAAILIMMAAGLCFFVAFHPGGIQGVSDPDTMLQWLTDEFQVASTDPSILQDSGEQPLDINPLIGTNPTTVKTPGGTHISAQGGN